MKNLMKAVAITLSMMPISVTAQDIETGLAASRSGDFDAAEAIFLPLAEWGDAEAQHLLGQLYRFAEGALQDDAKAWEWTLRAAEQGNAAAQYDVGLGFEQGRVVPRNIDEAAKWYQKSAEQGFDRAQLNLGFLFMIGNGVTKNEQTGLSWYLKAAEQGLMFAQENVAGIYLEGRVVPQDFDQAAKWILKAAEQGSAQSQMILGQLYANGDGVTQNPVTAKDWMELAAKQGLGEAQFRLGRMYGMGTGVEPDNIYAYMWLAISFGNGFSHAEELLGYATSQMTQEQIVEAEQSVQVCKGTDYEICQSSRESASAGKIKPIPGEILPLGAIDFVVPMDNAVEYDQGFTQLDWGWMDRQAMARCNKAGFGQASGEAFNVKFNNGDRRIIYVCEKHDAKALADMKNVFGI